MVFHQSPFTQERTEVQKGIFSLHIFDFNYGGSPSLGCCESYFELLNLLTVSRPLELSLQSSFQLSLTVLVDYRSHAGI